MSWIDDEELEDEFYGSFYNSPIDSVQIVQMLFNSDCQKCLGVSRAGVQLTTPGVITPEELIPIIKCQTANGFTPFSVLRFAIELDSANLSDFVIKSEEELNKNNDNNYDYNSLLKEVTYTDTIHFPTSVKALEPTATIFILYKRKQNKLANRLHRQTRVIRLKRDTKTHTSLQQSPNPNSNLSKNKNNRKTRRKAVTFDDDE